VAQAVIFDFGDTLDYLWVPKAERFLWLCRQAGITIEPAESRSAAIAFERTWSEEAAGVGVSWRGSLAAYAAGLTAAGLVEPEAGAQRIFRAAQSLPSDIHVDPAARALLIQLKADGSRLGIVSNHFGLLMPNLRDLGLDAYFNAVLDSALVGIRKPDPRIFGLACERLGVRPGDAVSVGDEPRNDVLASTQAGLRAILLDPLAAYGPDYRDLAYRSCACLGDVYAALKMC
jgi:putative hydrolase of the HAD superfamily